MSEPRETQWVVEVVGPHLLYGPWPTRVEALTWALQLKGETIRLYVRPLNVPLNVPPVVLT
jgi:hypothetical protein